MRATKDIPAKVYDLKLSEVKKKMVELKNMIVQNVFLFSGFIVLYFTPKFTFVNP